MTTPATRGPARKRCVCVCAHGRARVFACGVVCVARACACALYVWEDVMRVCVGEGGVESAPGPAPAPQRRRGNVFVTRGRCVVPGRASDARNTWRSPRLFTSRSAPGSACAGACHLARGRVRRAHARALPTPRRVASFSVGALRVMVKRIPLIGRCRLHGIFSFEVIPAHCARRHRSASHGHAHSSTQLAR